jgi:adenylyltransferase/sulfurtransferase
VLGVLPGIVGALQAAEAIKLVLGAGTPLVGRLLLADVLRMQFRELALERDPDCPLCGPRPTVTRLIDYEAFCGVAPQAREESVMEITVQELRAELDAGRRLLLLDVRQPWEYAVCHLEGSTLIPMGELQQRLEEIPADVDIVTVCHTGRRSLLAAHMLQAAGISRVRSLHGGVHAWALEIEPTMARY